MLTDTLKAVLFRTIDGMDPVDLQDAHKLTRGLQDIALEVVEHLTEGICHYIDMLVGEYCPE